MTDEMVYLRREKQLLVLLGIICLALIGGALYMQEMPGRLSLTICEALVTLSAVGGLVAAGRHVYIQTHPTESCGIDVLQPIVDGLPLASLFPLGFQVGGFCETPYPPVLGLSLAQWALVAFVLTVVLVPAGIIRNRMKAR
ncbi:disulfide bond formation protein B [Pseudomonas sp. NZIPFR-PS5]|nr:disulfide bond formation protein B [Pseudomonas sp. NZIPFR-PS5]